MTKKEREKLEWIKKLKKIQAEKRPLWRKRNCEELKERRTKNSDYPALAKKVEKHFPLFDEVASKIGLALQESGVFENTPKLEAVDLGEYVSLSTIFEQRQYIVHEGNAHLKIECIPEDDFYRDDILFTHKIVIHNTSWFPDEWRCYLDLPVDLTLLKECHIRAYVLMLKQFKGRIDLLKGFRYQDTIISNMCFDSALPIIEKTLKAAKVLKGRYGHFRKFTGDSLQADIGQHSSIILSPPSHRVASFSVGPADSKRHNIYFGLNMEEYDTMSEDGRRKLDDLIELMIILARDNLEWSNNRNVYCLQYDGW